jgi:hypothetical protein
MGRGRTVVVANAPSAESVQKLEALAGNPFTKNADFAAAVRACLSAPAAPPSDAEGLIGRVGFAIVSRLLEIFAGAAPRSAEEIPTDDAEEAPSHGAVVIEVARQFGELATSGASLEGLDISRLVDALIAFAKNMASPQSSNSTTYSCIAPGRRRRSSAANGTVAPTLL